MIRFVLFTAFSLLLLQNPFCQKYDYNWIVGYDSSDPPVGWWGESQINFENENVSVSYMEDYSMDIMFTGSTISDKKGNLLFYTNGCYLQNAQHELIENGDGLNPGNASDDWCGLANFMAYRVMQGALVLPLPDNEDRYWLFHLGVLKENSDLRLYVNKLYYTEINMAANNGLGKVTDKNHLLLEDTLCYGQLTAVRHGNGRDWWIIMPESSSNRYYKFLLTPQGISGPFTQSLGKVWDFKDWSGQAHFTPDGTQYLRYDTYNNLNIFDFDRCTGQLSNHRYVNVGFNSDTVVAGGLAISPNSRFAYVTTDWYVWQFDLWASDIKASQILVASIDWFQSPPGFYTFFYAAQLAPDGKIYINSSSSTDYMHIIHHPNELGLACDLEQHGLKLAGLNAFTMPYFPNYRQYDVPGSVCDTLGIDAPPMAGTHSEIVDTQVLSIFPNPAQNTLWINLPTERSATISLITLTGSVVREYSCAGGETQLSLSDLPNGIYLCRIQTQEGVLRTEKIVVQR
jgi:Secretion system C-terminal sorting domain